MGYWVVKVTVRNRVVFTTGYEWFPVHVFLQMCHEKCYRGLTFDGLQVIDTLIDTISMCDLMIYLFSFLLDTMYIGVSTESTTRFL